MQKVGTVTESQIAKLRKRVSGTTSASRPPKPGSTIWRQQHEECLKAIRAAKQMQAYMDAGGKLCDLPQPPPSEHPDYIRCPHCSRRFNPQAAERHIPKCATFQYNKTRPGITKTNKQEKITLNRGSLQESGRNPKNNNALQRSMTKSNL